MVSYAWMYRLGITPWERYRATAADSVAALLDREEAERALPLGRALDLGCGRGRYTPELARRGWEAVGIDAVPSAIEAAQRQDSEGVTYVVGDVTDHLKVWVASTSSSTSAASAGLARRRVAPPGRR